MKTRFLALALLPLSVLAQPTPLLDITDPEGDDVGDGSLVYPRDSAYQPGDLDLRSLRVFAEGKDLRFEATFRSPIRHPSTVMSPGMGAESLSYFARHGFYAFNLDIYLDTDRQPGSGNAVTLPGRRALLDPAHAWEKAIVLTPRPELVKRQLIDALRQTSSVGEAEVNATVDRSVFFPTQVRARGRTVSFVVPGSFIDAAGLAGASTTALVTAAPLTIDTGFNLALGDRDSPRERFALGVAQPDVGEPEFAPGYRAAPAPATSVVDLLSPDPRQQALQLARGGLLTGLNRENRMGAAGLPASPAAVAAAPAASASDSWFSRTLDSLAGVFGGGAAAAAPPATPSTPQTVQSLMAPPAAAPAATPSTAPTAPAAPRAAQASPPAAPAPAAPPPAAPAAAVRTPVAPVAAGATAGVIATAPAAAASAPRPATTSAPPAPTATTTAPPAVAPAAAVAPPAAQRPRDAAFFEEQENRLRTLKRLRDNGLISEEEYQAKRREVLDKL